MGKLPRRWQVHQGGEDPRLLRQPHDGQDVVGYLMTLPGEFVRVAACRRVTVS